MTKQNDANIATAPKEKANQKVQEQQGEDEDSCPTCTKYVREGVKCRVCDRLIHCRCEDITQQQVGLDYPDEYG